MKFKKYCEYIVTFTDEYSHYVKAYPSKTKNGVYDVLVAYIQKKSKYFSNNELKYYERQWTRKINKPKYI